MEDGRDKGSETFEKRPHRTTGHGSAPIGQDRLCSCVSGGPRPLAWGTGVWDGGGMSGRVMAVMIGPGRPCCDVRRRDGKASLRHRRREMPGLVWQDEGSCFGASIMEGTWGARANVKAPLLGSLSLSVCRWQHMLFCLCVMMDCAPTPGMEAGWKFQPCVWCPTLTVTSPIEQLIEEISRSEDPRAN